MDEFRTTFLYAVVFTDGELRIVVAEGFKSPRPENIQVGRHTIKDVYALDTSENSRLVEVYFSRPIAWQLVDESFTSADEYEIRDDNCALQVLTQSRYLDHVRAHHGWFEDIRGPGTHYRVWTEDEVVDIVACDPPTVGLTTIR